jgi:hypothetical protein
MGFEPTPSAVQRRQDRLPEISGACKMPANRGISALMHFPTFQDIHSGCCTVAAQAETRAHFTNTWAILP